MVKMGFSTQTTPFRPSSFCPPYFAFCRSCTRFYPFSSSSRVSCRLEDRTSQNPNGTFSDGARNADLFELPRRSNYYTFQPNESEVHHRRRNDFAYSQFKGPSFERELESIADDNQEVWYGIFRPGHTAADWGKATEECKRNKILFFNTSANLKTLSEEDIAEETKAGRRKIV